MKKLLILSGKGGTGKTTVAASMIELFAAKAFADCDVDAPNLHLVENRNVLPDRKDFHGSQKAVIDKLRCMFCGACASNCRFDAIKLVKSKYIVDEFACEGCGVCEQICPAKAIHLEDDIAGELMLYKEERTFSTAKLKMGRGNSGKLVTAVKQQLVKNSEEEFAIIDGSPGIGCPVVASISGVDMVLIVAEPSQSGISDMERILDTVYQLDVPVAVCINKYDISLEKTEEIISFCEENEIPFVGKIPLDETVTKAQNNGRSVIHIDCPASRAIQGIYEQTKNLLNV
ncbi:ATP-binding protein [Parablautia sp. Marseille-Q6255]|uniref:ATP-binding protein n=1 Tax=Parablautia sp. Marseille-Q6255 TaxID=3039593 RepID=UPI0024BD3D77|nr:ATP-binding protein [Parablautia sp. Marseille-Q6255]